MQNKCQVLTEKLELAKCFQCGKCFSGCPVSINGVLNIRRLMREVLLTQNPDKVLEHKELWDCTTCQTCSIRCPRGLKPHELIIAIRSMLVEEGNIPTTVITALEGIFKYGNPWGRAREKRAEWTEGLTIKNLSSGDKTNLLYYVSSALSYDPRAQEIGQALASALTDAQVELGILRNQEKCCGSEARRMGEEGLFDMLVDSNLKLFQSQGITQIVTSSPHCYNTLKNEYKKHDLEVKHYTQFVAELIITGKLKLVHELNKKVTYHDPCYLGKQNKVFDEPRSIIKALPGVTFIEFDRCREKSLCCEGGGGRMFVEASGSGERTAAIRVKDAVKMGVDVIATACPFCLLTLEDAVKSTGNEGKIVIKDIMELVAEAV